MKTAVALGLTAVILGAASACAPRLEAARSSYVASHPELSEERRRQILAGEVVTGMTPAEVEATLGPAAHRQRLPDEGGEVEVWTYPGALVFRSSVLRSRQDQDFLARLVFRDDVLIRVESR